MVSTKAFNDPGRMPGVFGSVHLMAWRYKRIRRKTHLPSLQANRKDA